MSVPLRRLSTGNKKHNAPTYEIYEDADAKNDPLGSFFCEFAKCHSLKFEAGIVNG
jgi:hypothetical protein